MPTMTPAGSAPTSLHDDRHGPLPMLLLSLTMVTGLVDAVSYLKLGHVFVANMTGNVVFLGFAVGAVLVFQVSVSAVLALALALLIANGVAAYRMPSSTDPWTVTG